MLKSVEFILTVDDTKGFYRVPAQKLFIWQKIYTFIFKILTFSDSYVTRKRKKNLHLTKSNLILNEENETKKMKQVEEGEVRSVIKNFSAWELTYSSPVVL